MKIALMGGARLEQDGRTEHLRTRQAACILGYLTLHRSRAVTRDELADALWGELPATWESTLRVVISRVRAALTSFGADARTVLAAGASGYRLQLPAAWSVDVEELTGELAAGESAWAGGRPDDALRHATAAAELGRGRLLPAEDGEWLVPHRDRVTHQRLRALEIACRAAVAVGDTSLAARAAEESLEINPLLEASHRLLMTAHAAAGDRAAALVAYERCRALLADALGTDPSAETQALHQEILRTRAIGPGTAPTLPGPLRPYEGIFVGRSDELLSLRVVLDRALDGRTEMAVVSGEPGIGKTRLCAELAREAISRGVAVLYGRSDEEPLGSYEPFVEALARRVREWPQLATIVPRALGRLLPNVEADAGPPMRDAQAERLRLFEGFADILEAAGGEGRGVLLVLDDLHWCDRSTLLILEHVVRNRPDARLAIVATYRGTDPPAALRDSMAEVQRARPITRVHLPGLPTVDIQQLVEAWSPGTGSHLARSLADRTDGNPFFALEILRHLQEGTEELAFRPGSVEAVGVPSGIRDVINRRLSRLSTEAQDVLLVASAVGRQFDLALIELLTGPGVDVPLVMHEAIGAELVGEIHDTLGQYRFAHHLVRQVLYDGLSATRRARLHHRIGEALEELVADGPEERVAELAHHFAGSGPVGNTVKAARYCALAGDCAMKVLAFEEAASYYERALACASDAGDLDRARLLISLADARASSGEVKRAWNTLQEAFPFADRAGLLGELGAALIRATSFLATNWDQDAWDIGLWALERLGDGDTPVRSILLSRLALTTQSFGAPPEAAEHSVPLSVQAHEMAERVGDSTALAAAIQARMLCDPSAELLPRRLDLLEQLISLSAGSGDALLSMNGHLWLGMEALARGDVGRAEASAEAFDRLGAATGHPWTAWRRTVRDATFALMRGDLDAAEELVQQELGAGADVQQATQYYFAHLYQLRREQGRLHEVEEALLALTTIPELALWMAMLNVDLGRTDDAAALFDRFAQDEFASIPKRFPGWWMDIGFLSYVADALGDAAYARVLLDLLAPYEGRHIVMTGWGGYWGPADLALGGVAATMGDDARAERYLVQAIAMCDDVRSPTWKARAQLRLAKLLFERDVINARDLLEQASATAERIGMSGLLEQIRALA